ncbi:MAG TPA: hypothetical protein VHY58_20770 [Streptosporangiaceae bacterium]|jgi:hypothetical protein|nr:hypothetical protein [Streptosporangiaceae bacterium]
MTTRHGYDAHSRTQRLSRVRDIIPDREPQRSDASVLIDFDPHLPAPDDRVHAPQDRAKSLLDNGRSNVYSPGLTSKRKLIIVAALAGVLGVILTVMLAGGGASWPASVTRVQTEAAKACHNPDVRSEPNQVNFACAKGTTAILWVFALLTSGGNPAYGDAKTGRLGLEPITPQQGGEVAWSLNLHSPYSAANAQDSLQVAARAINNIIGGATITGNHGQPVVQSGLQSDPSNCLRYTGSSALKKRTGYPSLCAAPITTPAGQAALVTDVYQKWMGATPQQAQNAGTLFEYADDPGAPQVQAILQHLPGAKQSAP